jgi:hypothetical protein
VVLCATTGVAQAQAQESPPEAGKSEEADACFGAAERAQPLLRQKRLREARALLEVCARDVCPRVARTDCREWLAEATDAQPSIVIAAHELRGRDDVRDIHGVRATIDTTIVLDAADAGALAIDPGRHRIRLDWSGGGPIEQNVDVHEGDKNRQIDFYWRAQTTVAFTPARSVPASVYLTATLGAVALAVGAGFEAAGLSQRQKLDSCQQTRSCSQSDVDSARDLTRVGDITLGASALLLVSAAVLYVLRPVPEPARAEGDTGWVFRPVPGGFVGGFCGNL